MGSHKSKHFQSVSRGGSPRIHDSPKPFSRHLPAIKEKKLIRSYNKYVLFVRYSIECA